MDIEEGPFETLDIVEVAINNGEVAMNNDNNQLKKMVTNSEKQGEYNNTENKINMHQLSIMSMKPKDDLNIGHTNKKSFTKK